MLGTEVGDSIPGEDTFYGNHNIWKIGFYNGAKSVRMCPKIVMNKVFSDLIDDANIHIFCVWIDTTKITVRRNTSLSLGQE